jgi:hypothetical protein
VITAERWYEQNPELNNYYQGDILSGIPFPALPTLLPAARQDAWGVLRPRPKRQADPRTAEEVLRNLPNELIGRAAKDVPDAWGRADIDGEYIIAHCRKMSVAVVSRSCDLDKDSRKHFLVAPVVHIKDLKADLRTEGKLRELRDNEIFHWFYLPERPPNLIESFADLSQMVPLHRTFFDKETLRTNLVARLSAEGTTAFQVSLSNFYGVKFGFSPEDKCPQSARYACSACFHSGRKEPYSREFREGDLFGDCGHCREDAIWVRMPEAR